MIATARTPYLGLSDLSFQSPPRVISEIKKSNPWPMRENIRPRISGELLCYVEAEGRWRSRRVAVRSGQLLVGGGGDPQHPRLALRRLNLTPGPQAHSFALRRSPDAQPLLTLQASNQREFDNWVRTIAIELIRQTPLDAVKYLDIFTITPSSKPAKDCNHNVITNNDKKDENSNEIHYRIRQHSETKKEMKVDEDEQTVELLLKKCQNSDSYVPVKEKLKLFESLCRLGQHEENVNNAKYSKRTRSLHDLSHSESNLAHLAGVKKICKYFETKNDESKLQEKCNTLGRIHRTSLGPVKSLISRKYSVQCIKH